MSADAATLPPPPGPEVELETYRGPLDLLLQLLKEEEVDIFDIPVARILDRYLKALESIEVVDINHAADFIVMAATLMEIKSRQLLPPEERQALELEEEDPRTDLVRQLLEYRRFREAADELGGMAAHRAQMMGRAAFGQGLVLDGPAPADPAEELREVTLYDLMAAFEKLMRETLAEVPRTIVYDDISVEERIEELSLSLRESPESPLRFTEFIKRASDRADAAAIFVAVLEGTRRKIISIYQSDLLGEVYISLRGERPDGEFAPTAEEQAAAASSSLTARHGSFTAFVETEEQAAAEAEEQEFAGDVEGRKVMKRLEDALRGAEQAIQRFTGSNRAAPPAAEDAFGGPVIRQWTESAATAPGLQASAANASGPAMPAIRQWTDPSPGKIARPLTSREIVKASLAFAGPPRIVYGMKAPLPSDFRSVGRDPAPNSPETKWRTVGDHEERTDEWGNTWRRLGGLTQGEPKVGVLEESWDLLDKYEFPKTDDAKLYERAAAEVAKFHGEGYFVLAPARWPFNVARYMRRMDNFLADVLLEPDRVRQLLGKLTDLSAREFERYADIGCDGVFGPEDWGTQDRLLVSPECWRELFKPCFRKLCGVAHDRGMAVFLHSCGKNTEVIGDWIEVGVDVLQFDQPELHGVDYLAERFGGRVHFWSPVDIQRTLQSKDEAKIEAAAREYVEKLGSFGGGFIAGYYGDNEGIGLDPKWQEVAGRAYMKYGDPAPAKRG